MNPDDPRFADDALDETNADDRRCRHGVPFIDFELGEPCHICQDEFEWYTRDEGAR